MRKQWIAVATAMLVISLGGFGVAAQGPGPQGAGAGEATQNSHAARSFNPVKWIKKDPNTVNEKPKKTKNKKHSAKPATPDASTPPPAG